MTSPAVERPGPASRRTTPPPGATVPEPVERSVPEPMEQYGGCFGCGPEPADGLRISHKGESGLVVESEFAVREVHQGAPGLAHGGLLATAMDEVLGEAAWRTGKPHVTGRLETDYLTPVPVGGTLYLRSWVTGVDGRKTYVEGEARIGGREGAVAVRAAGLFIAVGTEHFTKDRTNG
ncbi:PaaI family thioesterase [Actinomadura atramentaria]|uniref:PaaI family thioesterase n=1 Tax=Actinomadura atramentaria TaxID=1990 RepID=UPI0003822BA3|nr:PaaI family thioesterase [Actinomadura atramentaria]